MTAFGGLPLAFALFALTLLVLYMAAHWALAFGLAAHLHARLGWPLWAVLPPLWTAAELLRNYLFSGFPWADLGYTQVRTLPVAQLASLAGVYGIAALVVLVNGALAEALEALRARRRPPALPLAVAAGALALALAYGQVHLAAVRAEMAAAPAARVGVVQPNVDQSRKLARRQYVQYILDRLVPPTLEADRAGVELVVWPEASFPYDVPPDIQSFDAPGSGLPPLSHAYLLAGAPTVEWLRDAQGGRTPRVGNMLFLLSPELRVLGRYQKMHLVPFGEYVPEAVRILLPFVKQLVPGLAAVSPGRDFTVLELPAAEGGAPLRLAPLICFDAIFPEIVRTFVAREPSPDLLVNSTNDAWYGYSSGPYQFLAIVQLRAIEARRTVVRSAYAGVSAVILPTGELAPGALEVGPVDPARSPDPDEPARLLVASAPRLRQGTLYTKVGDLFAQACALFAAGALVVSLRRGPVAAAAARKQHGRN
jgi:apolipoprotein N-acyltransferase